VNLLTRLKETAIANADKTAFYYMDKPTSYAELDAAVTKFACGLQKLGLKKGDHIALLLGNSPHFVIGLYGAMRLGATVIPINPQYTPEEIGYILSNGDVKAVIALDALAPHFNKMKALLPGVKHCILCESGIDASEDFLLPGMKTFDEVSALAAYPFDEPELDANDTAVILYTSGTTGKPKGAMLTHGNLYSNARDIAEYLKMDSQDRVITTLPMFHVFSLTVVLNAPLISGATMLIVPRFSPKDIFGLARKYRATVFAGVPTMYNFLYQYLDGKSEDFSTIRLCISGGAPMPVALLKNFEEKFQVTISEGYGLSEASPVTCFNPLDRPRKPGSIGMSIVNVENRVVDELGREVPPGEVGELIVRGPNVMKGYYKLPEDTAAVMRDGWLYTGDLARMDGEGYFYIVDRKKDLVIVGGYNVYPREVEEALYGHPGIVEAAVIGVPDPEHGEAVKAFVVPKEERLKAGELTSYLAEKLAPYKIPSFIEFLDELPKNTTGKILRRALKDQIGQR